MNRLFWFINIVLLLLAVFVTDSIMGYRPDRTPVAASPKEKGKGWDAGVKRGIKPLATVAPADTTPIWKQSLFRPDRTEEEDEDGGSSAADEKVGDLDLIAICIIGDSKAAVILTASSAATQQPRVLMPGGGAQDSKKQPERVKHVFRIGQTIGSSGYTLKEINDSDVVIVRGGVEKNLLISFGDDSSKKRMEAAANDSQRRADVTRALAAAQAMAAANQTAAGNLQPQPPPPPPAPAMSMPGTAGAAAQQPTMSEETRKRIEEIKKRREDVLRHMQDRGGHSR